MKVLLDIKDSKASFVMELLENLNFVKTKTLDSEDEKENLQKAVEELNLIKQGKMKGIPAKELLDEL